MDNGIVQFLLANGYWIMFILMWLEGPIVTLAAAFLASLGFFAWPVVLGLSLLGDITGDIVFYGVGRRWGYRFVDRFGKYIGIKHTTVARMQKFFHAHGGKTVFMAKSTTGLCFVTFVAAGMAHMPVKRFLGYSLLGGVVWSSILVAVGYFFGYMHLTIARYISWAGWVTLGTAVIFFAGVMLYKRYEAKKLFHLTNGNNDAVS